MRGDPRAEPVWAGSDREPRNAAQSARAEQLADRFDALAGAPDAPAAVEATEALRAALWEELLGALSAPSAREVAELAERLAQLCAKLLAALLAGAPFKAPEPPPRDARDGGARDDGTASAGDAPQGAEHVASPETSRAQALIVDERGLAGDAGAERAPARGAAADAYDELYSSTRGRAGASAPTAADGGAEGVEIAVRDERGRSGSAAWIGAIARQLRHFEHDHRPFAVLLVEVRDLERVRHELTASQFERLCAEVERELAAALSSPEGPAWDAAPIAQRAGRYWLIAPARDHSAARLLAERIEHALAVPAGLAWPAPGVLIGIAVCPENARSAAALAAHADVDLYAARAAAPARA